MTNVSVVTMPALTLVKNLTLHTCQVHLVLILISQVHLANTVSSLRGGLQTEMREGGGIKLNRKPGY